ncbi:MAG: type II 3-dehydroquinate dehydratase [Pseudomonadota bacterium]
MDETASILLLNGPNLNLLGRREPEVYGRDSLADIVTALESTAASLGARLTALQSNAEHVLIDRVHAAADDGTDAILINPGAFTHTSIALRDAFVGVGLPFYEIHISNVFAREPFREISYLSDVAAGVIVGCGAIGYELALTAALARLRMPA